VTSIWGHLALLPPPAFRAQSSLMAIAPVYPNEALVDGLVAVSRLGSERCRHLIGDAVSGHLALSRAALPLVAPVTCAVEGDYLLVRAGLGWIGHATVQPGVVAFETSSTSLDHTLRWEVMVRGRAEVVGATGPDVPPPLWLIDDRQTMVLRIQMELLTGLQYGVPPRPPLCEVTRPQRK
jgi:hypothetical protein